MKKVLFFLLAILTLGFLAAPLSAQNVLTVHDGTATNGYVPVYGWYADAYLKAEFVYPASDLTTIATSGDPIIGMTFYAIQDAVSWGSASFQVFLTEVTDATISSFVGNTDATIVYEGSLSVEGGEMNIEFNSPYTYNGGNLLVGIYCTTTGSYSTSTWQGEDVSGASIQGYSYSSLSDVSVSQRNFLPKTTFTYGVITCPKPTAFNATIVSPTEVMLSWNGNDDVSSYTVEYGAPGFIPGEGAGNTETAYGNTINITAITEGTTYDYYVQADCGSDGTSIWVGPITLNASQYIMSSTGSDTITTCNLVVYDDGGPTGQYSANCSSTLVLYPSEVGSALHIFGTNSSESKTNGGCWDYLQIYDGVGTNGTQLVNSCGNNQTIDVISSTGPLTIYFYSDNSTQYAGFELNVECVTCFAPGNISANEITTESVTLTWDGPDASNGYLVYVDNGTEVTTYEESGETLDLNNLTPASFYTVQIQTLCDDGDTSLLSPAYHFNTACAAIEITEDTPWFENFEGYAGNGEQPFVCWATPVTTSGGGPFVYCGNTTLGHSGANTAELKGASNMLVLPEFTNPIQDLRLSFWATAVTPSNGTLEIGVVTDMDDAVNSFEYVATTGQPSSRNGVGNYMGPFDFNGVEATSGRIALRYTSSGTGNSWNLDDFTVELAPECNSPVKTSVVATALDGHSAMVSWVDNDDTHASWTVYYKKSTDNEYESDVATDTFLLLTGLIPETNYNVYVVSNCGGIPGEDATLTKNFTTLVACPAPTAVTASPVYVNDATITWNSTATAFNIEYGETGFAQGTGTTDVVYSNTITLSDLEPQTSYTFYVQADCGTDDGTSQWTSVQFTTLPSCPKPTQIHTTDVTTSSAELTWTPGYMETEWVVEYDTADFTLGTGMQVSVTGTPTVTLQNLTPNAKYNAYVRAVCSATDSSVWTDRYVFLTPCEATPLPYVENFDSYPAWYSPDCWRKFENGNSGSFVSYGAYIYNEQAYSGANSLLIKAASSASGYALLRLPDFTTNDITELQVKFMAKKYSGSRPLIVGITPDFNSVDSIYVLASFSDLTSTYTEKIVSLQSYPGTSGYLVIGLDKGYSVSGQYYVDDLSVEVRPNCMYPVDFTAVPVGETSVTLSWTELGTSESWNIEYGLTGFAHGEGTTEYGVDTTVFTIGNLLESSVYDFYVQSNCDAMESPWVGPLTVVTSQYIMSATGSDTITTCGMLIYDDGGANGDYSLNCSSTLVIYPAVEGTMMMLTGTSNTESNYDYLKIYDGVGTSGTPLVNYSGQHNVSVLSTTGPLTIQFTADNYLSYAGFELFAQCVSCFPPTNLSVSDPNLTGATISWSGNADEYGVYVILTDTAYYTTTDTFLTLTGLEPSSTYRFMVRSLCGADSSDLSQAFNFSTSCGQIDITEATPWFENFDGYTGTGAQLIGACWATPETQQVDNGLSPFVYCGNSSTTYSGANSLEMKGGPTMVVLPEFSNDINTLRISMWGNTTASNASAAGTMALGYISDITDPTTFEAIDTIPATAFNRTGTDAPHANFIGPYDFNGVTPQPGLRIALRLTGVTTSTTGGSTSWNLDDITVSLSPSCPSPVKTSVTITDVDGHNATINFTDNNPDHSSWTVYYKASTATDWDYEVTNITSVTLNNLDPVTTYEVYVVTNCDGEASEDATIHKTFTTTVACPAPANVTVAAAATEAIVTWEGTADSYIVVCGNFTETVTENTVTITDLTPATNYTVSVMAECGEDGTSTAATASFMTACVTVVDFPYTEGFENGLGCWVSTVVSGSSNWTTSDNYNYTYTLPEGSSCAKASSTAHGHQTELTSPVFDLTSLTNPYLSFYHIQTEWLGDQDMLYVFYRTSPAASYELLTSFTGDISTWQLDSIALPNPTSTYQIIFKAALEYGHGIGLDKVMIYENDGTGPVITAPTVVTDSATNVTQTAATLNGTVTNPSNVDVAPMGFEWKESSALIYTVVNVTGAALTHNLADLTPGTQYTYRAFITYNGMTYYGSEVIFTTTAQGQITDPTVATDVASPVSWHSATLNGTITNPDNVTITAKGFEWRATVGGTYAPVTVNGNDLTYDLTDLDAGTSYTYKAFITFNGTTLYGQEETFNTLPEDVQPCALPTNVTATAVSQESIEVNWDANTDVPIWNIQYRQVNTQTWNTGSSNTNNYTINGLAAETTYEIQVQAVCGDDNQSAWTASITATTHGDGVNSYLENSVNLYPNPAKEVVNVQCTMNNVQWDGAVIEVLDIYGKLLQTLKVDSEIIQINVSNLANGMYFVRVTTDEGVVTKRFVKK